MGVAIQTYRARIGTFKHFRCGEMIANCRLSRGCDVTAIVSDLKTIGCVIFIGVLLMISGVEPNPGPMENDSDSCQIDEVPGVVKREETIADGTQIDIPWIRIDGLLENIKKEMLEVFFENEERKGGGKVKFIEIDNKSNSALILFEEKTAVDDFMQRNPKNIMGMDVSVKVLESNTLPEQPKMIKLTKLSVDMNKIMLKRFLEEALNFDGKVEEVNINSRERSAIVTFDTTAAVNEIMNKRPLTIYGFKLDVDVCRDKVDLESSHTVRRVQGAESLQTTGDKVDSDSGNTERRVQGAESLQTTGDKVDSESGDTERMIQGTEPLQTTETEPDSLHENEHSDESQKMKTIQITKLPVHVNRNMLIQYFESKHNYFGKVVDVTINSEKHFASVKFEECAAVNKVMDKMPLTMFGSKVDICVYGNGTIFKEDNCYDVLRFWKWKRKFLNFIGGKSETSEPSMNKYKSELEKNGLTGLKGLLSKDLESLTSTEVHIAVTGASGAGKSSFINSIRGLIPLDPGAAKVGANETTLTCNRYEHPENKSFVVWDLPGVGTPNFPEKTYLEMVGYDQYDFFIIISKDRFTELDLWLAKAVRERNKSCFFVRSNIDATIDNNARDFKEKHNEKILLQTIRSHIQKEFQSKGFRDQNIFLISNCEWNKYDFGKLNNELLSSSDGLKKDTLALSLSVVTREVIEEKKRVLKSRIPKTALSIASESKKSEQKKIFQDEINFYQKQFNIDEETLSENKDILFLTDDNLRDFRVLFDESEQKGIISMKTPTASMNDVSALLRFVDLFSWSKEKTYLYRFSKSALEMNLDFLYHKTITFYDTAKFSSLVKKTTT